MEDLILNNLFLIQEVVMKFTAYFSINFTNRLADFWAAIYRMYTFTVDLLYVIKV